MIDQGPGLKRWRPSNYSGSHGASPLRLGIEKSRNPMTVRLAQNIDKTVVDYAKRFNLSTIKPMLSMSLGSGETT